MVYDFICNGCGEMFEVERRIDKRDNAATCPICGSDDTHRVIVSVPAIKLNWYGPALSEATVPRMMPAVRRKGRKVHEGTSD